MSRTGPIGHQIRDVFYVNRTEAHCFTCGRPAWWFRRAVSAGRKHAAEHPDQAFRIKSRWVHGARSGWQPHPPTPAELFPPTPTGC